MKIFLTVLLTLLGAAALGAGVIHGGGLTNFAADEPHPPLINGVIAFSRERFIAARSDAIEVPNLDDRQTIADGGAHYVLMCSGCHLGPGTEDTEIRRGLYPQPPNLAQPEQHGGHDHGDVEAAAKRQFWIIKHGIKLTAMPAWGATHDDEAIWGLVAFLRKLPELSPEQYAALTGAAAGDGRSRHRHGEDTGPSTTAPAGEPDTPSAPPLSHDEPGKADGGRSHAH